MARDDKLISEVLSLQMKDLTPEELLEFKRQIVAMPLSSLEVLTHPRVGIRRQDIFLDLEKLVRKEQIGEEEKEIIYWKDIKELFRSYL